MALPMVFLGISLALALLLLPAAASDGDMRDYTVPLGGGAELRMRTDAHLEAERPLVRQTAGEELVLDSAWGACDGEEEEGGGGCGHATGQTGRVVWPAAVLLLCTLQSQGWAGQHALELGSGTGIIGLALLRWGAASVVLTDLPHMLPTINANIAANPTPSTSSTIDARERSNGLSPRLRLTQTVAANRGAGLALAALRLGRLGQRRALHPDRRRRRHLRQGIGGALPQDPRRGVRVVEGGGEGCGGDGGAAGEREGLPREVLQGARTPRRLPAHRPSRRPQSIRAHPCCLPPQMLS